MDLQKRYIDSHKKSFIAGFILALLFGPIGLMYASVGWGVALLLLTIITASTVIIPIAFWLIGLMLSYHLIEQHNERVFLDSTKY